MLVKECLQVFKCWEVGGSFESFALKYFSRQLQSFTGVLYSFPLGWVYSLNAFPVKQFT